MSECVVYWLFDETCICPRLHGYVGITAYLDARVRAHRKPKGLRWLRIKKFKHVVLFRGNRNRCFAMEESLRPDHHIGWNRGRGGDWRGTTLGYPCSTEKKQKLSILNKGKKHTAAARKKMSENNRGSWSEESKSKLRATTLARGGNGPEKMSLEARAKMSASRQGNQNALGSKHSIETRARYSEMRKGNQNWKFRKPFSAEALKKMSEGSKKRWATV